MIDLVYHIYLPGEAVSPAEQEQIESEVRSGLRCAFCLGLPDRERIIQGPRVSICEDCVQLCSELLEDRK